MAKMGGHCPLDDFKDELDRKIFMSIELERYHKKPLSEIMKKYSNLREAYCSGPCTNLLC
ncbi:MAG: hypothetical protein QXD43_04030 [Candidatus Aenigmatarchaeota archaeon]